MKDLRGLEDLMPPLSSAGTSILLANNQRQHRTSPAPKVVLPSSSASHLASERDRESVFVFVRKREGERGSVCVCVCERKSVCARECEGESGSTALACPAC